MCLFMVSAVTPHHERPLSPQPKFCSVLAMICLINQLRQSLYILLNSKKMYHTRNTVMLMDAFVLCSFLSFFLDVMQPLKWKHLPVTPPPPFLPIGIFYLTFCWSSNVYCIFELATLLVPSALQITFALLWE